MLLKSLPEVSSSEDDGFVTKAIAIRINSKHVNDIIGLHIGAALYHYVLWN